MIELTDINLEYANGVRALQNINLFIDSGEFLFLMGPTGSGKSSLLKLIYRGELPSKGEVYVNNTDITELSRNKVHLLRRKIGVVFQDFKLLDYKTVAENVAYALEVTGCPSAKIPDKVGGALDIVGMLPLKDRYPDEISSGEKQLTSIARALVHSPPILLADEPTGNLDPESSKKVLKILDYVNTRGTTIIVATHDTAIVEASKRRIVYLKEGRLVSDTGAVQDTDRPELVPDEDDIS